MITVISRKYVYAVEPGTSASRGFYQFLGLSVLGGVGAARNAHGGVYQHHSDGAFQAGEDAGAQPVGSFAGVQPHAAAGGVPSDKAGLEVHPERLAAPPSSPRLC